jgi:hypothetical protein
MSLNLKSTLRGAAFALAALSFSDAANAQGLQTAGATPQTVATLPTAAVSTSALAKHCDSIKGVFILAKDAVGFTPPYEGQLRGFFKSGCRTPFPLPVERPDIDNVKTAYVILRDGGKIELGLKWRGDARTGRFELN